MSRTRSHSVLWRQMRSVLLITASWPLQRWRHHSCVSWVFLSSSSVIACHQDVLISHCCACKKIKYANCHHMMNPAEALWILFPTKRSSTFCLIWPWYRHLATLNLFFVMVYKQYQQQVNRSGFVGWSTADKEIFYSIFLSFLWDDSLFVRRNLLEIPPAPPLRCNTWRWMFTEKEKRKRRGGKKCLMWCNFFWNFQKPEKSLEKCCLCRSKITYYSRSFPQEQSQRFVQCFKCLTSSTCGDWAAAAGNSGWSIMIRICSVRWCVVEKVSCLWFILLEIKARQAEFFRLFPSSVLVAAHCHLELKDCPKKMIKYFSTTLKCPPASVSAEHEDAHKGHRVFIVK